MIITPTVNYRDLLRRVLLTVDELHVSGLLLDTFTFNEEERTVLKELGLDDSYIQDPR